MYNLKIKITGIFNQHSNNQQQRFLRGIQGSPGVGFSLTRDGNYDMVNKKLKNVGEGVESSDAVTKHLLETAINSKINTSPSSNIFVKKDSPEVGADLDMKGFAIKKMSSYIILLSGSNPPYSPIQNPCHISVIFCTCHYSRLFLSFFILKK